MLPLKLDPEQLRMILEAFSKFTLQLERLNDNLEGKNAAKREGGGA